MDGCSSLTTSKPSVRRVPSEPSHWTKRPEGFCGPGSGRFQYAYGPRATPTVDGDRVYAAGADGKLFCLDVKTGTIIWKKDYVADLGAEPESWGFHWGFAS